MARGRWKLKRDLAAEQAQIQSAAKKRGLWGSIGGTLLGGLAMAVTGGAATPVVAGLMAGGGKFIGGHLGNLLAGKTEGGKLKGGKFFQGEREALASKIKENIGAQAAKAGLTAGMAKLPGAALKFGKGGFSATVQKAGGQVGKAEEAVSQYTPGEGGIGRLLDFRGSFIGKGLGKMQAAGAAREAEALQKGMPPTYGDIDIDKVLQEGKVLRKAASGPSAPPPTFDEIMSGQKPSGPGFQKSDQIFPKPAWRSDVQQEAVRVANRGTPQATQMDITHPTTDYLQGIEKVGPSKFAGASEAQTKAISEAVVPSEYGVPKGVTWGETAIDPGRSNLSYALPDQGGGVTPYTGDVPDLMDLYQDELSSSQVERMQAAKSAAPIKSMQRLKGAELQDYGALENIEKVSGPTDTYRSQEGLYSTSIPVSDKALELSSVEQKYYDRVNQMTDQGYSVGAEGGLPEEYGRGYISKETGDIVRQPARPEAPFSYEEDPFLDESINVENTSFTEFDEASWAQGKNRIRDATRQAWWGGGPSVEEGLSSEPVGMGEFDPDIRTSFPQPNFVKPLGQGTGSRLQGASDLQKSSAWHQRLFGRRGY